MTVVAVAVSVITARRAAADTAQCCKLHNAISARQPVHYYYFYQVLHLLDQAR